MAASRHRLHPHRLGLRTEGVGRDRGMGKSRGAQARMCSRALLGAENVKLLCGNGLLAQAGAAAAGGAAVAAGCMPRTKMATAFRVSALILARSSVSTVPAVERMIALPNTIM